MFRPALILALVAAAVGCQQRDSQPAASGLSPSEAAVIRSQLVLAVEPPAAETVIEVRDAIQHAGIGATADRVSVRGQIGGMPNPYGVDVQPQFPWVDGQAVFFLVDPTTASQFEDHQHAKGEECSFCLGKARDLVDTVAMVQLHAEGSAPILARADLLLGLKEGDSVVVTGTAREELGMLVVDGTGVHVLAATEPEQDESQEADTDKVSSVD